MSEKREQLVLDERERQLSDTAAVALWDACAGIVASYPGSVPADWLPLEIMSLAVQAVVHQAEQHGMKAEDALQVLAKSLGCQIVYLTVDDAQAAEVRMLVDGWLDEAVEMTPRHDNPPKGGATQ